MVPKLIHPLPPALQSPETSPERFVEDKWMQASGFLLETSHFLSERCYILDLVRANLSSSKIPCLIDLLLDGE